MLHRFLNKASGCYIHVGEQNSSLVQHQSIAAKDVAGGYLDKTLTMTLSDFFEEIVFGRIFSKSLFFLDILIPFRIFFRLLVHYPAIVIFANKIFEFD